MFPQSVDHRESDLEPLAGAVLINHGLIRGLCALILRWGEVRTEGPTVVGERAEAESRQQGKGPGKGTCPSYRMPTGSWEAAGTSTSLAGSRWAGS